MGVVPFQEKGGVVWLVTSTEPQTHTVSISQRKKGRGTLHPQKDPGALIFF